jgi:6-phosphogluconate dehydrogenase
MLVKAGAPVDQTIATLAAHLERGDCIIDGGNEWYENTERREKAIEGRGLLYLEMGVSGGEEGARNGPSLMPGGSLEAYKHIEDILLKVAAQVPDSGPCVTYIGKGGSGNFVKMVHNGIEYGDMQLISEAYDVLKSVGKLTNSELQQVFSEWNKGELLSFLIEITADIFGIKDEKGDGYLVDKVLDKTGMKGTGKWTVQQAAELSVAAPTIEASLDSRFLSEGGTCRGFQNLPGRLLHWPASGQGAADRRCEASSICLQDLQLRSGHEHHQGQELRERMGTQPR